MVGNVRFGGFWFEKGRGWTNKLMGTSQHLECKFVLWAMGHKMILFR